ncbi:hypothetical protein [Engelhardtia mirabilis]|uniref:Uncharacterized protein n=1 Tax=Engelhardtia mirabilis TaxID=2528011 RepID=A0A518BGN4_9BACT|nr:hypothetical protein Pla133_11800 [Planctomycetes bacterium Pla133]QDV00441.1 hypothetical protein Pla86_11800 [Planctomycetes bacterium Pla86]
MATNSKDGSLVPASLMLVVGAAVGGALLYEKPFEIFRPSAAANWSAPHLSVETVPARLWQDPIHAVVSGTHAFVTRDEVPRADLVVPVLVPGAGRAEAIELRLRARYAVVAGFAVEGWLPVQQEAIGCLRVDELWHEDGGLVHDHELAKSESKPEQESCLIPFERFRSPDGERTALVLWVAESHLGTKPLEALEAMISGSLHETPEHDGEVEDATDLAQGSQPAPAARPSSAALALETDGLAAAASISEAGMSSSADRGAPAGAEHATSPPRPLGDAVCVLGPTSSNGLLDMLNEVTTVEKGRFEGWRLINYRATAPEALLLREVTIPGESRLDPPDSRIQTARDCMARAGIDYTRVLCTDDELLLALVSELELRGVDLVEPDVGLALVSELDTLYGRSMARTLSVIIGLEQERRDQVPSSVDGLAPLEALRARLRLTSDNEQNDSVRQVSYLRGLDGVTPLAELKEQPASGRSAMDALRQPIGPSQLDYIRRQAKSLLRRGWRPGGGGLEAGGPVVKAIGVVGTDPYDKQLVLQALRPTFEELLFFSTDLDARLLHPSQYPWTRNVVVATAYGLELSETLQGEVPPFRDGYQTATFLAGRLAIAEESLLGRLGEIGQLDMQGRFDPPPPKIYEVARSGAWDMAREGDGFHPLPPAKRFASNSGFWHRARVVSIVVLLAALYAATSLVIGRWHSVSTAVDEVRGRDWLVALLRPRAMLAAVAVACLVPALVLLSFSGLAEPFALAEGLSVWPTEALRFIVILVSIGVLLFGLARLSINAREIEDQWGLRGNRTSVEVAQRAEDAPGPTRGGWSRLVESLGWSVGIERHDGQRSAAAFWERYMENARPTRVALRVGIALALVATLTMVAIADTGWPASPIRGHGVRLLDQVLGIASLVSFTVLLLFVSDASRECATLIHRLTAREGLEALEWPAECKLRDELRIGTGGQAELIEIRLIARRTKAVGQLIVGPFFVLLLLVLSHNSYFDHWTWSPAIVFVYSLLLLLAVGAAMRMRHQAERARRRVVARLEDRLLRLSGEPAPAERAGKGKAKAADPDAGENPKQLALALEQIRSLREGAFAPWFQNPVIRAVLMPFGGAGALALVDLMVQSGLT